MKIMKLLSFMGFTAPPDDQKKVAALQQARRDFIRISKELTRQTGRRKKPTFAQFVDGVSKTLRLPLYFVEEVMWQFINGRVIHVDHQFILHRRGDLSAPEIREIDPIRLISIEFPVFA